MQQTWLRLLTHTDRIRDPERLGAWLSTTARRESLRAIANARDENATDPALLPDVADSECEERLEAEERERALAEALETLPGRWKQMMHMLLGEPAQSYAEISDQLGVPIGSIGPTRARCLERLSADKRLVAAVHG